MYQPFVFVIFKNRKMFKWWFCYCINYPISFCFIINKCGFIF